ALAPRRANGADPERREGADGLAPEKSAGTDHDDTPHANLRPNTTSQGTNSAKSTAVKRRLASSFVAAAATASAMPASQTAHDQIASGAERPGVRDTRSRPATL